MVPDGLGRRPARRAARASRVGRRLRLARTPVTNAEFGAFLGASGAPPPPFWTDPRLSDPEQPVVGVTWAEAVLFCEWLTREQRPLPPPADRGGVGARRAGRPGERPLSVGRRAARPLVRGPAGPPARAPARRTGAGQRVRADGSRRRRPRMVPRLVRRRRLRPGAGPRPDGAAGGLSPRVARRRLAPPGAVEPGGPPLEPAAPPPLLGLRLPGGARRSAGRRDRRPRETWSASRLVRGPGTRAGRSP